MEVCMNQYGFSENVSNLVRFAITKCFYPKARLIRGPFYVRGRSSLVYGEGFTTGHACRFDLPGKGLKTLTIGKDVHLGDHVHIVAHRSVRIGDNCLFASKIFISDTNHGELTGSDAASSPRIPPVRRPLHHLPTNIGNNVWVGENVVVLPGVTIGDGCIVGANAVVNRDVPPYSIVAGVPAKVVKTYDFEASMWKAVAKERTQR